MGACLPPVAVVFMEKATEFEWLRGNLFRIVDPNTGIIRIVEAAVLAESIARCNRVLDEWHERERGQVVRFPPR